MFFKTSNPDLSSLNDIVLASFSKMALNKKNSRMSRMIAKELGRRSAQNDLGIAPNQDNPPDHITKILDKIKQRHPNSFASGKKEVYKAHVATSELMGAAFTGGEYADYDETGCPTLTPS